MNPKPSNIRIDFLPAHSSIQIEHPEAQRAVLIRAVMYDDDNITVVAYSPWSIVEPAADGTVSLQWKDLWAQGAYVLP